MSYGSFISEEARNIFLDPLMEGNREKMPGMNDLMHPKPNSN